MLSQCVFCGPHDVVLLLVLYERLRKSLALTLILRSLNGWRTRGSWCLMTKKKTLSNHRFESVQCTSAIEAMSGHLRCPEVALRCPEHSPQYTYTYSMLICLYVYSVFH